MLAGIAGPDEGWAALKGAALRSKLVVAAVLTGVAAAAVIGGLTAGASACIPARRLTQAAPEAGTPRSTRLTPACYAGFAPGQGLVVWASLSVGPILSTVHVEWKTRKLQQAQLRDSSAARHGAVPLDFGQLTGDGRRGRLLLGPRGISEELVFVWRHGSDEVGVGIQVFEPLTTAVATLRAMVASVPRG